MKRSISSDVERAIREVVEGYLTPSVLKRLDVRAGELWDGEPIIEVEALVDDSQPLPDPVLWSEKRVLMQRRLEELDEPRFAYTRFISEQDEERRHALPNVR